MRRDYGAGKPRGTVQTYAHALARTEHVNAACNRENIENGNAEQESA